MPKDPKDMIGDILNAIGAMAELNHAYFLAHINAGFSQGDAWALTENFAKEIIKMAFLPKEKPNED